MNGLLKGCTSHRLFWQTFLAEYNLVTQTEANKATALALAIHDARTQIQINNNNTRLSGGSIPGPKPFDLTIHYEAYDKVMVRIYCNRAFKSAYLHLQLRSLFSSDPLLEAQKFSFTVSEVPSNLKWKVVFVLAIVIVCGGLFWTRTKKLQ